MCVCVVVCVCARVRMCVRVGVRRVRVFVSGFVREFVCVCARAYVPVHITTPVSPMSFCANEDHHGH